MVRVVRFLSWIEEAVVMPVGMLTVQAVKAGSVAVAAVSSSMAVAVPEPDPAAVKVVFPQPAVTDTLGLGFVIVKSGSTMLITSLALRWVFNANTNVMDVGADVTGLSNERLLLNTSVWSRLEFEIETSGTSSAFARVNFTPRLSRLAG